MHAAINYLAPTADIPFVYMYPPPPGEPTISGALVKQVVEIADARPRLDQVSLDREGFVMRRQASRVRDFYDPAERMAVYDQEIATLVRDATGAARVLVFDHTARRAGSGGPLAQAPVRVAHNDYTLRSGPRRLRELLSAEEAETALQGRFAIFNIWRPIRGPVLDTPLAICDARSIATADLVGTAMRYRERIGETYSITYNPAHRWCYLPAMQADEVLLFKGYDSLEDGRARFTAHSAFDHPDAPPDTAPRESIESRALAFFPA